MTIVCHSDHTRLKPMVLNAIKLAVYSVISNGIPIIIIVMMTTKGPSDVNIW
jgi:hypothetical protein